MLSKSSATQNDTKKRMRKGKEREEKGKGGRREDWEEEKNQTSSLVEEASKISPPMS